jgi:hypothetical protein
VEIQDQRTIDGHPITDGLWVWDYDLRRAQVNVKATTWADPDSEFHQYWDGWFYMNDAEGRPGSSMNGERMWVRHPRTGELASTPRM